MLTVAPEGSAVQAVTARSGKSIVTQQVTTSRASRPWVTRTFLPAGSKEDLGLGESVKGVLVMNEVSVLGVPESLRMTAALEVELVVRRRAREAAEQAERILATVNQPDGRTGAVLVAGTGPLQGSNSTGPRFARTVYRYRDHTRLTHTLLDGELAGTSAGFQELVRCVLDGLIAQAVALNVMAADAEAFRTQDDLDGRQSCVVLFVADASEVSGDPALAEVCAAYHEGRCRIAAALEMLRRRIELQRLREEHPELLSWWRRRAARKELAREAAVQRRFLHAAFDELSELDPVDISGLIEAHVAARAVVATVDGHR